MTASNNPTIESPSHQLIITREFNAPRESVWKAWTEPERIKSWLGLGEGITVESVKVDLRVGGKFRTQIKMEDGEYYTAAGTYLEVKARERLVYTWDWEKDGSGPEFGELEGNETQITVEFHESGKQTRLVLKHEKFATVKSRDNHEGGWQDWMGRFATFVEAERADTAG